MYTTIAFCVFLIVIILGETGLCYLIWHITDGEMIGITIFCNILVALTCLLLGGIKNSPVAIYGTVLSIGCILNVLILIHRFKKGK